MIRILGENAVPAIVQITGRMKDVKYDLKVEVGSALPFDAEKRIARYLQANQLLLGPPSPMLQELMRVLEIPNWRKILERHALWTQWMKFFQLMEAVKGGKIPPDNALQLLTQQAMSAIQVAVASQSQPDRQERAQGGPSAPGGQ